MNGNRMMVFTATMVATLMTLGAMAQDKKPAPAPAPAKAQAQAMDAKQKAAMECMAKAGAVGEPHKKLAETAGAWDATVRVWQGPGEPQISKGTAEITVQMGGRFIEERFKGTFEGEAFEGLGYTGYDNVSKKYTGVWFDSMSTGISTISGSMDPTGKLFTGTSTYNDPMTGKSHTTKTIIRYADKDNHTMEMYDKGPDGKEFRMMEIVYKRVK